MKNVTAKYLNKSYRCQQPA